MKVLILNCILLPFLLSSSAAQSPFIKSGEWSFGSFSHNSEAINEHLYPPHSVGYRIVSSSESYEFSGMTFIEETREHVAYFQKGFSYAVANNFMLGIQAAWASNSSLSNTVTTGVLQPELRYYFTSPFFISLNPAIIFSNQPSSLNVRYNRYFLLSIATGFTLFSTNDLAFEPSFRLNRTIVEGGRTSFTPALILRYFPGRKISEGDEKINPLERGNMMVGGSAFADMFQGNASFSLNPRLGYFFLDRFVLGSGFNWYRHSRSSRDSHYQFELNLFARAYPVKNLFLQMESDILLSHSGSSLNQYIISGAIGYSIFISRSIALEPTINYFSRTISIDNSSQEIFNNSLSSLGIEMTVQAYLSR